MKKHTHKLTRTSKYSFNIIIPKEIVEKYGWREKQKMSIVDKGRGRIELKDWKRR